MSVESLALLTFTLIPRSDSQWAGLHGTTGVLLYVRIIVVFIQLGSHT